MVNPQLTTVAILGGGKGGSALLDLLINIPDVVVIGVADKDPSAPGFKRASQLDLKVTSDVVDLITDERVNLIVDVTGDPSVSDLVETRKRPGTEVLGGATARLLWNLMQHEIQMQSQLLRAEKLASIGTFASGLAHDINNPLYLILGLAENLLQEKDPAAIREQAQDIAQAVRRISSLSKELTRYARHTAADGLVDVELNTKLEEALKIARYASLLEDLTVIKDYAARAVIKANPDEILHVFVNILTNAVHAMNGRGTITLATEWAGDKVRVSISDTGCGIPEEDFGKIFDPFFTTKPPGKGTGLGLHNVSTVVKQLNGHVFVESEVGKGTTFRLEFPKA